MYPSTSLKFSNELTNYSLCVLIKLDQLINMLIGDLQKQKKRKKWTQEETALSELNKIYPPAPKVHSLTCYILASCF